MADYIIFSTTLHDIIFLPSSCNPNNDQNLYWIRIVSFYNVESLNPRPFLYQHWLCTRTAHANPIERHLIQYRTTTTKQVGRQLLPTHLNQSNYLPKWQQPLGSSELFTSLSIMWKNVEPKPFCWAKTILRSLPAWASCGKMLSQNHFVEPKPFCWGKPACFDSCSSNLNDDLEFYSR